MKPRPLKKLICLSFRIGLASSVAISIVPDPSGEQVASDVMNAVPS
jgi:hypothetical protein